MYEFNISDVMIWDNRVYLSNSLYDYFLNNLFLSFAMGLLLGCILGFVAESIGLYIKSKIEILE